MTAQQIKLSQIESWGVRGLYPVTKEEFRVLLEGGGSLIEINKPNGDGTFFSSLRFQGIVFCTSTDGGIE